MSSSDWQVTFWAEGLPEITLPATQTFAAVAAQLAKTWDRSVAAFLAGTGVESPCSARVMKQTLRDGARVEVLCGPSTPPPAEADPRVPVLLLTGFLGSGKTTLMNRFLRDSGLKISIIENEFGEVAIDEALVHQNESKAEQVYVVGGLVNDEEVCKPREQLLDAFSRMSEQMDREGRLDLIIIETSGLADPVPIMQTMRGTPSVDAAFRLGGVVTLADTATIGRRLNEGQAQDRELIRQLVFADLLVLTKTDLVTADELRKAWTKIRRFTDPRTQVVAAVKGEMPAELLVSLRSFEAGTVDADLRLFAQGQKHVTSEESERLHQDDVGTFTVVRPAAVDEVLFARFVRFLEDPKDPAVLYRAKGIMAVNGQDRKLIFHSVGGVCETVWGPAWDAGEARESTMVFIGKQADKQRLTERFLACTRVPIRADASVVWRAAAAFLPTCDAARLAASCAGAYVSAQTPVPRCVGVQPVSAPCYLHTVAPLAVAAGYLRAFRRANGAKLVTPLTFATADELLAAAVTYEQLAELDEVDTQSALLDFAFPPLWYLEKGALMSDLQRFPFTDAPPDPKAGVYGRGHTEELTFRLRLAPLEEAGMEAHRLELHLGGRITKAVYQLAMQTVQPNVQFHLPAATFIRSVVETDTVFPKTHALWAAMHAQPSLRCLVRLKPEIVDGKTGGNPCPLTNLCG